MISLVIPVYNEEESVGQLHKELMAVLRPLKESFEVIFVDDGSTDGTLAALKKLKPVSVISFSRNFGKSQALQVIMRPESFSATGRPTLCDLCMGQHAVTAA